MDRHVWQRLATMVLAALVIFSINTFSPIDNGGGLGITTIQTKEKIHQLPNLLGQQVAILVSPDINPNWIKEQGAANGLIYSIVKPDDMVPAEVSEDYSCLVTSDRDKEISLFFKTDKKKVTIKYTNHDEKLYIKTVPLSRLVEQSYRTKEQYQQMSKYASALRAEQLIGHHKLGL